MNDAQFFLAAILFRNKYFEIPLKTDENVPKNNATDIIKSDYLVATRSCISSLLFEVDGKVLFWNSPRGITFYIVYHPSPKKTSRSLA